MGKVLKNVAMFGLGLFIPVAINIVSAIAKR